MFFLMIWYLLGKCCVVVWVVFGEVVMSVLVCVSKCFCCVLFGG